jgi:hypothetical protein
LWPDFLDPAINYRGHNYDGGVNVSLNPSLLVLVVFSDAPITAHGRGQNPAFNILRPLGSLAYNYYQPVAGLEVALVPRFCRARRMELLPVLRERLGRSDLASFLPR